MKKTALIALLTLFTAPAFALLSPLNQSIAEIKAILDSPEMNKRLNAGDVIEEIIRAEKGYEIETTHSEMFVEVIPVPADKIGPQPFQLNFHKAVSRD